MNEVTALLAQDPELTRTARPFVIPQYPSIPECVALGASAGIAIGAQDIATEDSGPYTGEVSGAVLAELGCEFVEVGHAERRAHFGDTDDIVSAKVHAAVRNGLTPLLCVGEAVAGDPHAAVAECIRQIDSGLAATRAAGLVGDIVIAYEPLWAIGAPKPAGPDHIRAVCSRLREYLESAAEPSSVIYGGSAGPGMLATISDSVDGLFLGRFAHEPQAFGAILNEVRALA